MLIWLFKVLFRIFGALVPTLVSFSIATFAILIAINCVIGGTIKFVGNIGSKGAKFVYKKTKKGIPKLWRKFWKGIFKLHKWLEKWFLSIGDSKALSFVNSTIIILIIIIVII